MMYNHVLGHRPPEKTGRAGQGRSRWTEKRNPDKGRRMTQQKYDIVLGLLDRACVWSVYVGTFAATLMLSYLISPFQTANWIIGFGAGLLLAWVTQGAIIKKARWVIYSASFCLAVIDIVLAALLTKRI
jgi:hypothetical protein